ncbi:hypothetical protein UCRPA7_5263 [Phaeoacremonium minimum UCRPA7]|uniref:Cytochrome oxidase c assembly domain-containing protein n=1 Tax=Phaeoacremonium minimum (strain UCR-PA7) TaxID=1286976 RepID=R8BJ40_PHAM7|nr:hypothetical protein UCRPA7_5263 [Phaeoacremonium minimum UCRPA7]EON99267.1 hypothetical protein UCRPA7_5263 [Phaeoacremonium minimum UCRPA7]
MAVTTSAPRSVSDATRFTQNTPHATSKPSASSSPAQNASRFPPASGSRSSPPAGGGSAPPRETPEQRVARLRAAHLAAKQAEVSRFDRVVSGSRRFFDSAHKFTVVSLLGFTAIAGLLTVYTTVDMLRYNRKRKSEFVEAQRQMSADSLEAARLAYMRGDATDEQIALVEEANARAGGAGSFFKAPSILGAPKAVDRSSGGEGEASSGKLNTGATWPGAATAADGAKTATGLKAWLFSSLKKEEEGEDVGTGERRLGWESLSEEDDGTGVRDSDLVRAIEEKQAYIKSKAAQAFEKEKQNQRKGGPLDRVGVEPPAAASADEPSKKKGWWW